MEIEGLLRKLIPVSKLSIYGLNSYIDVVSSCSELAIGAEAKVFKCLFLGVPSVVKIRNPKPFLDPSIDAKLRYRRTRVEARAIVDAIKLGIKAPHVLWVDASEGILVMEFVEGVLLREALREVGDEDACRFMKTLGEYLAKLHSAGIVHGDPTTSNLILARSGELYFIDFGLAEYSSLIDEYAVDVHIAFRAIESTHFDREELLKRCLVEGYSRFMDAADLVLRRVREIRLMGRYVEKRRRSVWGELHEDSVRY